MINYLKGSLLSPLKNQAKKQATDIHAQISLTQTKYNVLLQNQVINYFCGKPITF